MGYGSVSNCFWRDSLFPTVSRINKKVQTPNLAHHRLSSNKRTFPFAIFHSIFYASSPCVCCNGFCFYNGYLHNYLASLRRTAHVLTRCCSGYCLWNMCPFNNCDYQHWRLSYTSFGGNQYASLLRWSRYSRRIIICDNETTRQLNCQN